MKVKHSKTGKIYEVLFHALSANNCDADLTVEDRLEVIYKEDGIETKIYVRKFNEMFGKVLINGNEVTRFEVLDN